MDEFERIKTFLAPLSQGYEGAFSLLDDVARLEALNQDDCHLVTMDSMVEKIHFLPHSDPFLLAQKLLQVNLSDLAAKGAWPESYFLSLALPPKLGDEWLQKFAQGLEKVQKQYGFFLSGGDCVLSPQAMVFTVTLIGKAPKDKRLWHGRGKLEFNQDIYVTGTIGDGFLGLAIAKGEGLELELSSENRNYLEQRYLLPQARLEMGRELQILGKKHGFSFAAMDISDGLMGDAQHLLTASQNPELAIHLYAQQIPLSQAAQDWLAEEVNLFPELLNGGDDYEILFAAPPEAKPYLMELSKQYPISLIGKVTKSPPPETQNKKGKEDRHRVYLVDRSGDIIPVQHKSYLHRF